MKVLVTGGGTDVPIDDVRYIGNFSSGRFASDITVALTNAKIETTLLTNKRAIKPHIISANLLNPSNIHSHLFQSDLQYYHYEEYQTFYEYLDKCRELIETHDVIVSAAAVSDYIVDKQCGKIDSYNELTIQLKRAPKILPLLKQQKPTLKMIGFKLLVNPSPEEKNKQINKILNYGCNFVVYNDLQQMRTGHHNIELHYPTGEPYLYNIDQAKQLVKHINEHFTWNNR